MERPVAKFLTGFAILAALLVVAGVVFVLSQPAAPPTPVPNPNGYDDFVKAGGMITSDFSDIAKLGAPELRTLLTNNSEALDLARRGLTRQCRSPLYSLTNAAVLGALSTCKRLANGFAAEGRLAELENRPGDAAESYLTVIRLGHEVSRGGIIISSMVGIAIELIGATRLEKLTSSLNAGQCRKTALALETAEARREPMEATLDQERLVVRRAYGIKGALERLIMFRSIGKTERGWKSRLMAHEIRSRKLMIDLAARAFELEQGRRPNSLAELVPAYLQTFPQDPMTGTNMVYRP